MRRRVRRWDSLFNVTAPSTNACTTGVAPLQRDDRATGRWRITLLVLFLLWSAVPPVAAAVTYLESEDGDLSDDYLEPTAIVLGAGSNILEGSLDGFGGDVDLFTLSVLDGQAITAIRILEFSGGGAGSFLGLQPGMQLSADPALNNDFPDPIGFALIGPGDAANDEDVLDTMVVGPPFFFADELASGSYAGWLNELEGPSSYRIAFEVAPEPDLALLLMVALVPLLRRGRRP